MDAGEVVFCTESLDSRLRPLPPLDRFNLYPIRVRGNNPKVWLVEREADAPVNPPQRTVEVNKREVKASRGYNSNLTHRFIHAFRLAQLTRPECGAPAGRVLQPPLRV